MVHHRVQWYGDLLGLIFFVFLLIGAANLADGGGARCSACSPARPRSCAPLRPASTGRAEWRAMADGAVTMTRTLTQDGRQLPPDWAELTASGALRPEPAPDGSQPQTQYGPDAQRTVAWFAASCDPQARALAARWWPLLRPAGRTQALALHPDGTVLDSTRAALPLVASAAAAKAAGDGTATLRLLRQAAAQQHSHPTYYGGAWNALGTALLTSSSLSPC